MRRLKTRTRVAIAATTVMVAMTACSSSGTKFHIRSHSPRPSASTTTPPDAHDQVITVHDLPSGWTVLHKRRQSEKYLPQCYVRALGAKKATSTATVAYEYGGRAPYLREQVAYFGNGAAKLVFAAALRRLDACTDLDFKVKKIEVTGTMSTTSFPDFGDESRAYTASLTAGHATVTIYLAVIRIGSDVIGVSGTSNGTASRVNPFAQLVGIAVDKITSS